MIKSPCHDILRCSFFLGKSPLLFILGKLSVTMKPCAQSSTVFLGPIYPPAGMGNTVDGCENPAAAGNKRTQFHTLFMTGWWLNPSEK